MTTRVRVYALPGYVAVYAPKPDGSGVELYTMTRADALELGHALVTGATTPERLCATLGELMALVEGSA